MKTIRFRKKVTLSILLTAAVIGVIYTGYNTVQSKEQMEDMLIQEHVEMAMFLTSSFDVAKAKVGIAYNSKLMEEMMKNRYVTYIRMVKPSGEIYLSTERNEMGKYVEHEAIYTQNVVVIEDIFNGEKIKTAVSPSEYGYTIWLGFSLSELNENIVNVIIFNILIFIPVFLGLTIVSSYISKSITNPVNQLMKGVKSIRMGNLDHRIDIASNDELGDLGLSFNEMCKDLKRYNQEIEGYNKNLERKVAERTKELYKSKIQLERNVEKLEKNKIATLNIMRDLRETVNKLSIAEIEIKKKNIELEKAHEGLKEMNKSLEKRVRERTEEVTRLLAQKDEFVNQLGHDLKTPLNPLINLIPIVRDNRDKLDDKKTKEMFEVIIRNVNYMKNLVTKTLELARLNAPSTKFNTDDINLLDEIYDLMGKNKQLTDKYNIKIVNNVKGNIFVNADKLRIQELLENLIGNSIKYSNDGGTVTIDAMEEEGFCIVSVKDDGIGMSKKQISHAFEEFYKADSSRHDFDSSGLGMPICKRIVEKHGGKIWVESEGKGKGTSVFFSLKSVRKIEKMT